MHFCNESINATFDIFDDFGKSSGLKINYNKTEILRIGSMKSSNNRLYTAKEVSWSNDSIRILGIEITVNNDIEKLNILPLISKMENIIKMWSWRQLTLYGKITIINTLLLSQLIYRLTVLPSPSEATLRRIDKILFDYLWDGKPHKIAKKIISNQHHLGGTKMPNVHLKNDALKCSWVVKIYNNPAYTLCPSFDFYSKIDVKEILKCNLSPTDIDHCWRKKPCQLWVDVLKSWCSLNYESYDNGDITNQILWFNSNIKIFSKPVFYPDLYRKGIKYISDLKKEDGMWYSHKEFEERYQIKINSLNYYSLIKAIPNGYRLKCDTTRPQTFITRVSKLQSHHSTFLYNKMLSRNADFPHKAKEKWATDLNTTLPQDTFSCYFQNIHICTISTKLRDFQYRLLNQAVITNTHLFKWKIIQADICTFCEEQPESILHLLVKCKHSQLIWNKLFVKLHTLTGIYIQFTEKEQLLGITYFQYQDLFNLIFIITKQYIYACRCLKTMPSIEMLISKIKEIKHIEQRIAIKNNKINQFNLKWQIISDM